MKYPLNITFIACSISIHALLSSQAYTLVPVSVPSNNDAL